MSQIIATGSYLPDHYVSNDALIEQTQIDSSHEWIKQRTGISGRHFVKGQQTVADLAINAAKKLLKSVKEDISKQIQYIVVASMSNQGLTPNIASHVQGAIEATQAWAFDLNGACNGFVMALEVANCLSRTQSSGYTLVIGAEAMSQIMDFTDRSVCILFGDGAGAVLIKHDGMPLKGYRSQIHSQFDEQKAIEVPILRPHRGVMKMKGREVFNFVNRQVIPDLKEFVANVSFDYLISHQANERLLALFSKQLHLISSTIPQNIEHVGNMSAASIPVLMDEMVQKKQLYLDQSKTVVFVGFGGGLSWGFIQMKL